MDYEKKYKEALGRARTFSQRWQGIEATDSELALQELKEIFPELQESEDERIRKEIIRIVDIWTNSCPTVNGIPAETLLAWLEKKGVQKSADKVEPKFKVGDWIIDKQGITHRIANVVENVTNHTYGYDIVGGGYFNDNTEGVRLWTIQDAKDGDVLVASDGSIFLFAGVDDCACKYYIALTTDKYVKINKEAKGSYWETSRAVYPATKEQRDFLFQRMKEAGYKWDAEKKELKKIEQKTAEWSEEDEKERKRVVGLLEGWLSTFKDTCYAEDCKCGISWLKSLKQRMKGE